MSKKKGRGISSTLMTKVGKGKVYKKSTQNTSNLNENPNTQTHTQYEEEMIAKSRKIAEDLEREMEQNQLH